ncbi:MAG: DUF6797 domain-containing protein, partial [Acidobacteriota bacterium]
TFALPEMENHPILRGVPRHEWNEGLSLYLTHPLSETAEPLVLGRTHETTPPQAFAWINEYKEGSRQFFFTAGHPEHIGLPGNQALLYNAIFWALGKEVPPSGVLGFGGRQIVTAGRHFYPRPPSRHPPARARILFDGKDLSRWDYWFGGKEPRVYRLDGRAHSGDGLPDFKGARWSVNRGSTVAALGYGDIITREQFSDYKLHLDFLIPQSPADVHRIWRGNSGVYLNGRYEIQILDSSGEEHPDKTSCGAINGIKAPDRLACAEPGHWQNMKVIFKAARFEGGEKVSPARVTVVLNGVTIHDNVEIPSQTTWGFSEKADDGALRGPIRLQADSSRVRFANIWLEPLWDEEAVFYFPQIQPKTGDPWLDMDYGPFLTASIEAPWPERNVTYKGIAIPMKKVYGSHREEALIFDTDLLRYSVGWKGDFVDLRGVVFDGTHKTHPRIKGEPVFANPVAPGWAKQGAFDDPRPLPWGPLPREWAHFKGLYLRHNRVIFSYTVGKTSVLEMPGLEEEGPGSTAFTREINLGRTAEDLILQVLAKPGKHGQILFLESLQAAPVSTRPEDCIAVVGGANRKSAAAAVGAPAGSRWVITADGDIRLKIPASSRGSRFKVLTWSGPPHQLTLFAELVRQSDPPVDLQPLTGGGPPRWRQKLVTKGQLGSPEGPYAIDIIGWPADNPWDSWMRFGGFDFFADGERAAICTWNGDVWIVSGIGPSLERLTWQRIATGLFQPLGLKIVDEQIYVLGRDQITILHDLNGDGEADFYENFNNDQQVTEHFHEFAMDLQTDTKGNFYYMKGGRHALDALIPQHGTLIRVAGDGSKSEILANGFRAPNGLLVTPDGQFISSDQQGHWVPANRINLIKAGGFYGYMWSYHQGERPTAFDEPLAWIHPSIDRSPSSFVWVNSDRWGPFQNRIISPSYGMGKLELILREDVDGVVQGGLTRFPLDFETGIMRGRFHPGDGQLYLCGLFGWSGNKTRPGGFYRVRYTGKPAHMPSELRVARDGVVISFTNPLDPNSATDPGNYHVQVWNYRRTEKYGSPDFKLDGEEGRDQLLVETAA